VHTTNILLLNFISSEMIHVSYAYPSSSLQLNYKRAAALVKAHVAGQKLPGKPSLPKKANVTGISTFSVHQRLTMWLSSSHFFGYSLLASNTSLSS
jgi:hypothetical protein